MNTTAVVKKSQEEYFKYLNELRESGACNMFGAAQYLEQDFDLDRKEAKAIVKAWMVSFKG